jgi:hypothetical protein
MFDFINVKRFLLFLGKGTGAMVRDVLLRIRGRRRFVPATGTASSLVVFSSQQCGISARTPIMACASTVVPVHVTMPPAFRRRHLPGKAALTNAVGRLRTHRSF